MSKTRWLPCALLVGACASRSPAPTAAPAAPWEPLAAWDSLCPVQGLSPPTPLRASIPVSFEPSGGAVWEGRVLVVGDKQAMPWFWVPGTAEVTPDPRWTLGPLPAPGPDSCCAVEPGPWGSELKRKKAAETCADHQVAPGSAVPWLKAEAATSGPRGLWVTGNMGFGCADNGEVRQLAGPDQAPRAVTGATREGALTALGVTDVRVEGLAAAPDGALLLGIRQVTAEDKDRMVTQVVVFAGDMARTADVTPPPGSAAGTVALGLSDLAVMPDGHVVLSVSREEDVDGRRVVAGELWRSVLPQPWKSAGAAWTTTLLARVDGHKPEGVVPLSRTCAAVLFDDDEKFKAQNRGAQPTPEWDRQGAFVSYLRVRP